MAYIVNTFDGVGAYLRDLPGISEDARRRVAEAYLEILAEHADYFLKECPLAHESYLFQFDYLIIDGGSFYTSALSSMGRVCLSAWFRSFMSIVKQARW